jgi:hypothetical protein
MSQPTQSDVHVNVPLTNLSVLYANQMADYQADNLAPIIPSKNQTNVFFKYPKDFWFRDALQKRSPGGEAARIGYGLTTDSFYIDIWSGAKMIDDQVRANTDSPLDDDQDAMMFLTTLERLRREIAFAGVCMTTGVWGTDVTGNSSASVYGSNTVMQWSRSGSTPLEDIANYRSAVKLVTGVMPNVLAMGQQVWDVLKNHAEITARITGGATTQVPAEVTKKLVAGLMELDDIIVLSAVQNTANEGAAFAGAFVVGKVALLMYRNPQGGVRSLTAVRTFTWQTYAANDNGVRILKYRQEPFHSDVVEIESGFIHKIIAADVGIFFNTLVQ